jgi:hypothetical protein
MLVTLPMFDSLPEQILQCYYEGHINHKIPQETAKA